MKLFRAIPIFFGYVVVIVTVILTAFYLLTNKETKPLTDSDRTGTPGKYIRLSQGVTHYQLAGPDTGKVVILVHGFSVPYYIWNGTYEYLVEHGFRVLRYDMYGRGYSDRPDVAYNQQLYDSQLLELIKKLNLKTPVSIGGVSFGGAVVTNFACKHPEIISKVLLVDPVYIVLKPNQPEFLTAYGEATHGEKRALGQLEDFKYPKNHPDWVARYRVQMQYKGFRNALVSTLYNYNYKAKESNACLNNTHKPVLLIWGKEDRTVPFTYSDSVRSVLKADFYPVDDAAHLPFIEQPDKVNARILGFLSDSVKIAPANKTVVQAIINPIAPSVKAHKGTDDDCVFTGKFSAAQRLKRYPFYKAIKILAVSYKCAVPEANIIINGDKKENANNIKDDTSFDEGLHVVKGKLNYSSLKEIEELTDAQIKTLSNIIYNTKYRKPSFNMVNEAQCFEPRNALLFFDKSGNMYDYMELCFSCENYTSKSDKLTIGTVCTQKFDLLKKFFVSLGIKYGTVTTAETD